MGRVQRFDRGEGGVRRTYGLMEQIRHPPVEVGSFMPLFTRF